jgi:demethylmenaquinone methyltransferase / 2-methoxy-6-polyprenyl-1,4-benzoquinol methylase
MSLQSGCSSNAPPRAAGTPADTAAWSAEDLLANPHEATDKPERVERMFTAIARRYDMNNRLHSFGRDQAWRRAVVRLAQAKPGDDVLDMACGTGDLTEAFACAKHGPRPRSVVGGDFTDAMLEIARAKTERRRSPRATSGRPGGAGASAGDVTPTYVHADAMNLPFEDRSFDIVSIAFGIRNVGEPARALREFRRVLRPGGRLVVLEFSQPGNRVVRWLNAIYTRKIMPWTATLISGDRSGAYHYLPKSVQTFTSAEAFVSLLRECGFKDIQTQPMTFGVCTAYVARPA